MKKTVDVFIRDSLIASYPVVLTEIDQPTDEDYVDQVKRHMRRHHKHAGTSTSRPTPTDCPRC